MNKKINSQHKQNNSLLKSGWYYGFNSDIVADFDEWTVFHFWLQLMIFSG